MLILGIESSCDETAAAVLDTTGGLLANIIHSQVALHAQYGGVVPELASRDHIKWIQRITHQALAEAGITLDEVDGIAVTRGPGLVGSLLVGLSFAKALALVKNIPIVGVDHLVGHLTSVFLGDELPHFPYLALTVSGGHTSLVLVKGPRDFTLVGCTLDDAAGEAFDKVAKLLGLEYPGGPSVARLATDGDPGAVAFPRAMPGKDNFDFSFSGVKTAVANYVREQRELPGTMLADICASFQEAVCDVLVTKTLRAAVSEGLTEVVLAGGVAANTRLREMLRRRGVEQGIRVIATPLAFCTDNAAMICMAAKEIFMEKTGDSMNLDVYSRPVFTRRA